MPHEGKNALGVDQLAKRSAPLPPDTAVVPGTAREIVHRRHDGASCQGSSSTVQRGAGHCPCAHAKKFMPSGSLIVRCSLERTIHGRSGSCSVIVKPYSRTNVCSPRCQEAGRKEPAALPGPGWQERPGALSGVRYAGRFRGV